MAKQTNILLECPEDTKLIEMGVIDIPAFKVWFVLQAKPILTADKVFFAEDGLTEINLGWLQHYIKKMIEHLPESEQVDILVRKTQYQKTMSRAAAMKRKAFGSENGVTKVKYLHNRFNVIKSKVSEVLELFGKYYTVEEVYEIMTMEYRIPVTRQLLKDFRRDHMSQIEEKKRLYSISFSDVRLGHKRSRIEELCLMYNLFKAKMLDSKKETTARLLKDILKDIKEEVEGDVITINGSVDINMVATIEHHVKKEALKHISIRQIIIGRVAAKNDVSVEGLIARLSDSYYSGFTKMSEAEDMEYEEVEYPSEKHYDFNVIETQEETRKIEAANKETRLRQNLADLAKEGKKKAVKQKLMALLKSRAGDLANNRIELDKFEGKKVPLVKNTNQPKKTRK